MSSMLSTRRLKFFRSWSANMDRDSDVCVCVCPWMWATNNKPTVWGWFIDVYSLYMLIPPVSVFDIPQVKCNSDTTWRSWRHLSFLLKRSATQNPHVGSG
jgi:hypothetical protein